MVDELVRRFLMDFPEKNIAIVSVDPSKRKTGGALLGDRIRMNSIRNERVYMRSLATRQSNLALSKHVNEALAILKAAQFDLIILETSGIGQSDTEIMDHSDAALYIMTPEFGAATQLEKIDMLDFADVVAINKFDKRGALDALRDVRKQYKRNHQVWDAKDDDLPVFGTIASQFNDPGTNRLYRCLIDTIGANTGSTLESTFEISLDESEKVYVIPPSRTRYLSEISESNRAYDKWVDQQCEVAEQLYSLRNVKASFEASTMDDKDRLMKGVDERYAELVLDFDPRNLAMLEDWDAKVDMYAQDEYVFKVRDKELRIQTKTLSLSNQKIPKVSLPKYKSWSALLKWMLQENVPGEFPYTAGIYPFKREGEDPARMFCW